ncbi:TIGR00295 family protein [Methanococcoides burtonii]|uniref:HD domain containing protein, metal dependent phosphohydrolase n=1 Tax=Methanococcoides burtonii (strain DSM 6242 / NBRC 107633 / OCM 468 / ACE-M) TaxID=259564 RepID=Q12YV8_METBU|nr:TIGR00295 family protein [Methanococcoides burtonii]ABE51368.1 HD domain containing protein, metal dependent phosphohydrolase [Methanococcoides burtonii DSM 6242]
MLSGSDALKLLKDEGCADNVIRHCQVVSETAVSIACELQEKGQKVDIQLVEVGALLHDLGRSRTHGIKHAIEGASIAEKLDLDPRIIQIIKNHIGAGITSEEAKVMGLPEVDHLPISTEEKIVAHADNLVMGDKRVPLARCIRRMHDRNISKEAIQRVQALADEFNYY